MSNLHIASARLVDGAVNDIEVRDGVVTAILPRGSSPEVGWPVLDVAGNLLMPSLIEPHAHLDKAFLADRVDNDAGDLMGAIRGLESIRHTLTHEDTVERALSAVRLMSSNGVTAIRSHADTTLTNGLASVEALLEVKARCADYMDLQVCALVEWPLTGAQGAERRALARDALDAGADVLGGCPHLDPDPAAAMEFLLSLSIDHRVPLDVHADENMRKNSRDLETLADLILAAGTPHPVSASHCVSLSRMTESDVCRIAEKAATAGVSVISLPQTNLFLQARDAVVSKSRAIAPVALLGEYGVNVAGGSDNLQDPFNPMGRGDPFETAALLVTAAHVSPSMAFSMITTGSRRALGLDDVRVAVGSKADFVSIPSTTLRESIASAPHRRSVVKAGVVVDDHIRNKK